HDHGGPDAGRVGDAGVRLGVDEVEERLVYHDEVQVDQQVQQPDDLAARDVAAVGGVRVADDGDARAAGADEVHERVHVELEAAQLVQLEHVDALAGLHRLVRPAPERRDRGGEALAHQQVVDPGDQLRGPVAHHHRLRVVPEHRAQLRGDRVGVARVVLEDLLHGPGELGEHPG